MTGGESSAGGDMPGSDIPGGDIPGQDIPGRDVPGGEVPDGGTPAGGSAPMLPARFHRHASGEETVVIETPSRPSGDAPPPPPGRRKRNLLYALIGLLVAFAVGIGRLAAFSGRSGDPREAASTVPPYQLPPEPENCVAGAPGAAHPRAGLDLDSLLLPADDLPGGWQPSDEALPFATRAQLVAPPDERDSDGGGNNDGGGNSDGASTGTLVGLVTLAPEAGDDLREIADDFLACLIHTPRYDGAEPLPAAVAEAQTHDADGTAYLSLTARVITGGREGTGGDAVILVIADSAPRTMAIGIAPLGEPGTTEPPAGQAEVLDTLGALRIRPSAPAQS